MRVLRSGVATILLLGGCAGQSVTDLSGGQVGWVSYPSTWEKIDIRGELVLPDKARGRVPAMIIAHASGGLDRRNERWAVFLREHGMATFQLDYFGPRGIDRNSASQPMPTYDAYDALRLLATHPMIDARRIGIIGFSRGAQIALGAANAPPSLTGGQRFAAHVALYPSCGTASLAKGGSGAPVLVLVGTRDDLTSVTSCERLIEDARAVGRDATLIVYEGAYHGWDGDYNGVWFHRAINRSYAMYPDQLTTEKSRTDVLVFLKKAFASSPQRPSHGAPVPTLTPNPAFEQMAASALRLLAVPSSLHFSATAQRERYAVVGGAMTKRRGRCHQDF